MLCMVEIRDWIGNPNGGFFSYKIGIFNWIENRFLIALFGLPPNGPSLAHFFLGKIVVKKKW